MALHPIVIALDLVTRLLLKSNIPYMVFGGIANSIYGNPRQTFDIDIKIILENDIKPLLADLNKIGKIVPADPITFISETNVIPLDINAIRVNLVRAELAFEKEAILRSRSVDFFGVSIKLCTPEDLIIQKAISVREKDWADIKYLVENLKNEMDWDYLLGQCKDLSGFLNDPDIYDRIKRYRNGQPISNAS